MSVFHKISHENEKVFVSLQNYTSEVLHLPIFHASPLSGVFLTPAFTSLFPLLESDVKRIELLYNAGRHAKVRCMRYRAVCYG